MTKILIDIIAGARPNFMKIAIIHAIRARQAEGGPLCFRLIHTGQHYDARMSGDFFEQLDIPDPDINLEAGSGTQAEQTGAIMTRYERVLLDRRSDLCLVVGDVISSMACAITAQKLHVPVAHVEAGIRSGDWAIPEEINRPVTDSITNWFFTTSQTANETLRRCAVAQDRIFFVGNTMIDMLLLKMQRLRQPDFFSRHGLLPGAYFALTLHRPANFDRGDSLVLMLQLIARATRKVPAVFPARRRSAKTRRDLSELLGSLFVVDLQSYREFKFLVKYAKAVITDSGGTTEETTVMGMPC